ncbi:MAG: catalase family protein, partial [Pseudomonadota bacterium]|nr:catalase family protein [Pseudomonadota bacterium]
MNVPIEYQPSYEQPEHNEAEVTEELVETLRRIATTTYEDSGHAIRGVHAKGHGLLRGELTVNPGLPAELAQGMFTTARSFPVILRLSTTAGDILDDDVSTPRGFALKVLGVEGERLPGSERDTTQDFLMVDGPAFLKPDAKSFLRSLKLLAATTDKAEGLKKALSAVLRGAEALLERAGGQSATLKSLGGHPATHILGATFFSQTPYLHGPYMAKFSIEPLSANLRQLEAATLELKHNPNALREAVCSFFEANDAEWQLRVQLCTDL